MCYIKIINIVRSCVTFLIWGCSIAIVYPFIFLLVCLPESVRRDSKIYHYIFSWWCWLIVRATFVSCKVFGRENVPVYPNNPAVVVMNHGSALDIPAVMMVLGMYPQVWMSNDYRKTPLLGFILKRMHVIVLRSGLKNPLSTIRSVYALTKNFDRHVCLFPEGRRYNDGEIHSFYSGYAVLAEMLERPVVPILLVGTHALFPKNSWYLNTYKKELIISIGKPISRLECATREEFLDKVANWFKLEQDRLRYKSL